MTGADPKVVARTRRSLLRGITKAATQQRRHQLLLDNLIITAVKNGCTQTAVAEAAGVSQGHVSRLVGLRYLGSKAGKPAKRAKRGGNGGTV